MNIADIILVAATIVVVIGVALLVISTILLNVHAENITAVIRINEQSILENQYLEDGSSNVNDAWFTINEERYENNTWFDMGDWVWPEGTNEFNTSPLNKTLVLPQDPIVKVCFEDDREYKSCKDIHTDTITDTVTFLYPR